MRVLPSGMRGREVRVLDAFGGRYGLRQAPSTARVVVGIRLLQLPFVTGSPGVPCLLASFFCWKAGLDRARTRFGEEQSPAEQRESRNVVWLHACRVADTAKKKNAAPNIS